MSFAPWDLEANLCEIPDGQLVDVVAEVVLQHPGCVALRTLVKGQIVFTDLKISTGYHKVTIFRAIKMTVNEKIWLTDNPQASVLGHKPFSINQLQQVVESCAGMAVVDSGYQACGANVVATNDMNIRFCQWMHNQGKHVIAGDITLASTVQRLSKCARGCLSAGVACQPWSSLGDQRGERDPRAQSLPGVLTASFLLQVPAVFLECTTGAESAEWFQSALQTFAKAMGFAVHQKVLHLHEVWPAKRSRWWAVLSHPCFGFQGIPDFPAIAFKPSLVHLFPKLMRLDEQQEQELALDRYELRHFATATGGLKKSEVNFCLPLPTATHSWGSQVKNCHCGCRSSGFNEDRLREKGLYGQIIPLEGEEQFEGWSVPRMRHLHPSEVAIANAAPPKLFWNTRNSLRLELAGVGQCASPIQSIWVYGNFLNDAKQHYGLKIIETPTDLLKAYGNKLFEERDEWLKIDQGAKNKYLKIFEHAWQNLGKPLNQDNKVDDWSVKLAIDRSHVSSSDVVHPPKAFEHSCVHDNQNGAIKCDELKEMDNEPLQTTMIQQKGEFNGEECSTKVVKTRDELDEDEQVIFEFFHPSQKTQFSDQQEFQVGGVPGFETTAKGKRRKLQTVLEQYHGKQEDSVPNNGNGGSCLMTELPARSEEPGVPPNSGKTVQQPVKPLPEDGQVEIHLVRTEQSQAPSKVVVKTGQQIATAEEQLDPKNKAVLVDWLGNHIDLSQNCKQGQLIRVVHSPPSPNDDAMPVLVNCTKGQALWNQKGWVNEEEMEFYLSVLTDEFPGQTVKGCSLPDNPMMLLDLGKLILQGLTKAHETQKPIATYVKYGLHWTPIVIEVDEGHVVITTEDSFQHIVHQFCITIWEENQFTVQCEELPSLFKNDCGFQTIGWLHAKLLKLPAEAPFTPEQAVEWRILFHEILEKGKQDKIFVLEVVSLAGARNQDNLKTLLREHGVHSDRIEECASQLVQVIGQHGMDQILSSPKPWADLKARANLVRPPVQIVLASELQEMIRKRAESGKPVGSKSNKSKKNNETVVQLKSGQLEIPHAVFKQEDGTELSQIQIHQMKGATQGVVLANIEEAIPFFTLASPITKEGMGLLVLEYEDSRIPQHSKVRVPATCKATGEPVLITAALVQVGTKQVSRNVPNQCLAVQEVENTVIKVLVYQDQYPQEWSDFVGRPVKTIMGQAPFDQLDQQDVLDVWDRQFLSMKLTKASPQEATIFAVNIRVNSSVANSILAFSGNEGKYMEPRTSNGRQPCESHQVVWLHRKNYREAVLAKQMTDAHTTLVRSGERYGLRVENGQAEGVHQSHRPDLPYIPGVSLKKFKVAPIPYGSTRQSLTSVFKKMELASTANQPTGANTRQNWNGMVSSGCRCSKSLDLPIGPWRRFDNNGIAEPNTSSSPTKQCRRFVKNPAEFERTMAISSPTRKGGSLETQGPMAEWTH